MDLFILCLALNIYFEARNEPPEGQMAVAEVTLRRAATSGKSVCNEVFTDVQFSWTAKADQLQVTNKRAWESSQYAAKVAFFRNTNHSLGATHFHADYVRPKWAKSLCHTITIGRHIFYKECNK